MNRSFFSPWSYFLVFLISNALISYFYFPLPVRWTIAFLGLLVPFIAACRDFPNSSFEKNPPMALETLTSISPWAWMLLLASAFFLRLNHLTSLSTWPMPDEGQYSFFSMDLAQSWRWKFFFTQTQNPPLTNWLLALFYKFFDPSLFSLWLFPVLASLVGLLGTGWVFRKAFSGSFTFLFLAVGAVSFPFLFPARFCQPPVVVLSWTLLTGGALGLYAKHSRSKDTQGLALILGVVTGLGFFVAVQWLLAALSVGLAFFYLWWNGPQRSKGTLGAFVGPVLLSVGLYGSLWLREKAGFHILDLWAFKAGNDGWQQVQKSLANLTSLFWTPSPSAMAYGPHWGGVLNPVLGALFFWGMVEGFIHRREPWAQWSALSFILFMFPGLATRYFQIFRDVLAFPLLAFGIVVGLQSLLSRLSAGALRPLLLVALFGLSTALDFYHLEGPYHALWGTPGPFWRYIKSGELYQADNILESVAKAQGPGAVLSELRPDPTDRTLTIASYRWDAAQNRGISRDRLQWVAAITNANDKPFLAGRFPEGKWYWLGKFSETTNQPQMLAVIPWNSRNAPILQNWVEANDRLKPATYATMDSRPGRPQKTILDLIFAAYPYFHGDRFLESCFWEKVVFHLKADHNKSAVLAAIQQGLKRGYPLPQWFNDEGVLWAEKGEKEQARRAFEAAIHSPVNFTPAAENLRALENSQAGF